MKCKGWPVGVCSWSLRTDVPGVAKTMKELGLQHVHLGIRGAVEDSSGRQVETIRAQRWTITCTMIDFPQEDYSTLDRIRVTGGIVPDDCWEHNRDLFFGAVDVTAALGVKYLSMHLGFLDHKNLEHARKIFDRTRILADCAVKKGLTVLLETGQETAAARRESTPRVTESESPPSGKPRADTSCCSAGRSPIGRGSTPAKNPGSSTVSSARSASWETKRTRAVCLSAWP